MIICKEDLEPGILLRIQDENLMCEWVDCDEGWYGDYQPDCPEDEPLVRFDVSRKVNGEWEEVPDASYCTAMRVDTDAAILEKALLYIFSEYKNALYGDLFASVKRLGERLSWISPEDFK